MSDIKIKAGKSYFVFIRFEGTEQAQRHSEETEDSTRPSSVCFPALLEWLPIKWTAISWHHRVSNFKLDTISFLVGVREWGLEYHKTIANSSFRLLITRSNGWTADSIGHTSDKIKGLWILACVEGHTSFPKITNIFRDKSILHHGHLQSKFSSIIITLYLIKMCLFPSSLEFLLTHWPWVIIFKNEDNFSQSRIHSEYNDITEPTIRKRQYFFHICFMGNESDFINRGCLHPPGDSIIFRHCIIGASLYSNTQSDLSFRGFPCNPSLTNRSTAAPILHCERKTGGCVAGWVLCPVPLSQCLLTLVRLKTAALY